jgi:soluble lytic murein transglycosylase-like protein
MLTKTAYCILGLALLVETSSVQAQQNLKPPSVDKTIKMASPVKVSPLNRAAVVRLLARKANEQGFDFLLLVQIAYEESRFNSNALSPKGAQGLLQVMPATGARFGYSRLFDPEENVSAGIRYLQYLYKLFDGDVALILAGYNAGEGAVIKYGYRIPPYPETQSYVRNILARYLQAANSLEESDVDD